MPADPRQNRRNQAGAQARPRTVDSTLSQGLWEAWAEAQQVRRGAGTIMHSPESCLAGLNATGVLCVYVCVFRSTAVLLLLQEQGKGNELTGWNETYNPNEHKQHVMLRLSRLQYSFLLLF